MSDTYRSPGTYSKITIGFFTIGILLDIFTGILGFLAVTSPETFMSIYDGENPLLLAVVGLLGIGQLASGLGTIVFFLMWLYRAHSNLTHLHPTNLQFTPGWAVGWWFIPFANLVKPFQVVREVWWESDPEVDEEPTFLSASLHAAPTYMGVWWAFWLISNFVYNFSARFAGNDLTVAGYFDVIANALSAVAAALAIYLVKDITDRQELRSVSVAKFSSVGPPPPPTFDYAETQGGDERT